MSSAFDDESESDEDVNVDARGPDEVSAVIGDSKSLLSAFDDESESDEDVNVDARGPDEVSAVIRVSTILPIAVVNSSQSAAAERRQERLRKRGLRDAELTAARGRTAGDRRDRLAVDSRWVHFDTRSLTAKTEADAELRAVAAGTR